MLVIGTLPDPYTIAFDGVEIGSIKAMLDPRHTPIAGGIPLTPDA